MVSVSVSLTEVGTVCLLVSVMEAWPLSINPTKGGLVFVPFSLTKVGVVC